MPGSTLMMRTARISAAVVLFACAQAAAANPRKLPRPKGLPASVPENAAVTRWSDQGEGGLLSISWDRGSMLWAEPCRSREAAERFSRGEGTRLGCPLKIDMQVRPLYLGTLDPAATKKSRGACCYTFEQIGNR